MWGCWLDRFSLNQGTHKMVWSVDFIEREQDHTKGYFLSLKGAER